MKIQGFEQRFFEFGKSDHRISKVYYSTILFKNCFV
jgi:hypothetical protein